MRIGLLFLTVASLAFSADSPCGAVVDSPEGTYWLAGDGRAFTLYRCAAGSCSIRLGTREAFAFVDALADGLAREKNALDKAAGCVEKRALAEDEAARDLDRLTAPEREALVARHRITLGEVRALRRRLDALRDTTAGLTSRLRGTNVGLTLTAGREPLLTRLVTEILGR